MGNTIDIVIEIRGGSKAKRRIWEPEGNVMGYVFSHLIIKIKVEVGVVKGDFGRVVPDLVSISKAECAGIVEAQGQLTCLEPYLKP